MRLVHNELTKPQRMLRAYTNRDVPPYGFKGNPMLFDDGRRIEHDLTHFHLSRYTYLLTVLVSSACELFDHEILKGPDSDEWQYKPKARVTHDEIMAAGRSTAYLHERVKEYGRERCQKFLAVMDRLDDEVLAIVNDIYERAVRNLESCISYIVLLHLPEREKDLLDSMRAYGNDSVLYNLLADIVLHGLKNRDCALLSEKENIAYSIVVGYFTMLSFEAGSSKIKEREAKETGLLGRALFSRRDNQAWRFLHKHLFDGSLTQQFVLDAVRISRAQRPIDQTHLDTLLRLHTKYGFTGSLYVNDLQIRCPYFRMEASPFTEKYVGQPIGNFEIAVYPTDALYFMLQSIRDPSFEHADGAVALAALTIHDRYLILEEIQSDMPALLMRVPESNPYPHELSLLKSLVDQWSFISLAAVREFARRHGFTEFFASTPSSILRRYCGTMHPDKTRIYFNTMEKLGGLLVDDESSELDRRPQFYWRFDV